MRASSTAVSERAEKIISIIKNANGELVSGKDLISEFGLNPSTFYTQMMHIKRDHPEIVADNNPKKKLYGYRYVMQAEEVKEPATEEIKAEVKEKEVTKEEQVVVKSILDKVRYDEKKNDEGYNDPTAYLAMRSLTCEQVAGDIWEYTGSNDMSADYLVLASRGDHSTVIQIYLYAGDIHELEKKECLCVKEGERKYYFNPSKIYTKPAKYATMKVIRLSKECFNFIQSSVNDYLKIVSPEPRVIKQRVEVPVEKIVEKEVVKEVPVPIITEVPTPVEVTKDVDMSNYISLEEHAEILASTFSDYYSEEEHNRLLEAALDKERAKIYCDILCKVLSK